MWTSSVGTQKSPERQLPVWGNLFFSYFVITGGVTVFATVLDLHSRRVPQERLEETVPLISLQERQLLLLLKESEDNC